MKCKTCGTDHRGVAKHGGYCLNHQEQRAEAAEARAAAKSELIDIIIATWEQMTERLLDSEAQRNTAWSELREIREAIHADENEATSDEVQRVVRKRDELARKLEQAQKLIDELYTAWRDAPLMVGERNDRIDAMTKAALIHYGDNHVIIT